MQALQKPALGKRCRYYHSQMDMELLHRGEDYYMLPNAYVIFICDFDPFGKRKYCYTFESICIEDKTLLLEDGRRSVFLSTQGENEQEVSKSLVNFLHFVKADLTQCEKDFQDEFVESLQKSVRHVKESREMEERFMLFQETLKEEREEGRMEAYVEMLLILLETKGVVPSETKDKIKNENDAEVLMRWYAIAIESASVEQFLKKM